MLSPKSPPTSTDVVAEVTRSYEQPVMNNIHRSEYVEALVLLALKDSGWIRMKPWDGWDCEHESGLRLEVKQSAATPTWGRMGNRTFPRFDIAPRKGFWKEGETWVPLPAPARLADIYVFAWHGESRDTADQRDPARWEFFVTLTRDLPEKQQTISLAKISRITTACRVNALAATVERSMALV